MAARRYSAGTIFLQVVPVFNNVQRAIEDNVKDMDRALGDQMERAGDKAGKRAGKAASEAMNREIDRGAKESSTIFEREFRKNIDSINKALGEVDTKRLSNAMRSELKQLKKELDELSKTDLFDDRALERQRGKIEDILGGLRRLRDNSRITFQDNFDQVERGLRRISDRVDEFRRPIEIDIRTEAADRKMSLWRRSFTKHAQSAMKALEGATDQTLQRIHRDLDDLTIDLDLSPDMVLAKTDALMRELRRMTTNDIDVEARLEANAALAHMAAFSQAMNRIDGRTVTVDVDVDKAVSGLNLFRRHSDDAANSFRAFNGWILAGATLGPALIPVLGGIAGGLLALGPAAAVGAAGLSSVLIGFSGVGDAVKALGQRDDATAKTAASAANTQIASAKRVADARRSAARAVESALDRQKDAQERYADSIQDVKDAEESLRQAREAARGTGDDIADRIKDNKLAQDQGLLDVFSAQVNFDAVTSDGSSTNAEKEQARIDLEEAKRRLEELREEQKELAKEKAKWDKDGVNGTEQVKTAQERLSDAIEAQKDAYEDLRDAAQDVDRARADGARNVTEAIQAQGEAMNSLTGQQAAVDTAFNKLGASGKRFSLFLHSLRKDFGEFRNDIQDVLLPSVEKAIEGFMGSGNGSVLRKALVSLADSFGKFTIALSTSFQGPAWGSFFQMLADLGPDIQEAYGNAFIKFLEAVASMLATSGPFALKFAEGLEAMMTKFADWAASPEGRQDLLDFLDWVKRIGPDVLDFFGSAAKGITALAVALAPLGGLVLEGVTDFFDLLSDMDPGVLSNIATSLVVMVVAYQVANGIRALGAGFAAMLSPVGLIVAGFILIGAALVYLYKTNEGFRKFVNKAWKDISKVIMKSWRDDIKPALDELVKALKELWDKVLQPFLAWLGPIIVKYLKVLFPLYFKYVSFIFRAIALYITKFFIPNVLRAFKVLSWAWKKILKPLLKAWWEYAKWMWKNVWKPFLKNLKEGWQDMMSSMKRVWNRILKPLFKFITDKALPKLKSAFQTAVDGIKTIWDGLRKIVGTPIKFIINTVLRDGLVAGFNKVASWVGQDGFKFNGVDWKFATGGVLPGYTPGRDVHDFYSPTAGRLALSGGEAIMRPEWTQAVGFGFVDRMNAAARGGGVAGVRRAFSAILGGDAGVNAAGKAQGFATGGVLSIEQQQNAQRWARRHDTASYQMGAVGPSKFDCSGFMSALTHVLKNEYPYARIGSTATFPWTSAGFKPGAGQFSVASTKNFAGSGVGHMAGTLGGLNVESRAGDGVVLGDLARGSRSPGLTTLWHLGASLGELIGGGGRVVKGGGIGYPKWIMKIVKDPLGYVKGLISKPIEDFKNKFQGPMMDNVARIPDKLVGGVKNKVWSILPGPAKDAAKGVGKVVKGVGNALDAVVPGDGVPGFARGGVIGRMPYNGTMMYDNGGYLPPGLTTVMNLTGKPEPVFTPDQWSGIETGDRGGNIHYEPHFEGSNLTSEDVAADMNFTARRLRRAGKYAGVGQQ